MQSSPLNGDFGGTYAPVVMAVVEDAELTWGDTMDSILGMYLKGGFRSLLKFAGKIFGGVTDLKCNVMD